MAGEHEAQGVCRPRRSHGARRARPADPPGELAIGRRPPVCRGAQAREHLALEGVATAREVATSEIVSPTGG